MRKAIRFKRRTTFNPPLKIQYIGHTASPASTQIVCPPSLQHSPSATSRYVPNVRDNAAAKPPRPRKVRSKWISPSSKCSCQDFSLASQTNGHRQREVESDSFSALLRRAQAFD